MNNELIELLTKLEENTNLILAENKRLEDEIKALKENASNEETTDKLNNILICKNNAIASNNGIESTNINRLSTDYIPVVVNNNTLSIKCSSDLLYTIRLYDDSKKYIGYIPSTDYPSNDGWTVGDLVIKSNKITSEVSYIRLLFKYDANGTTPINSVNGTVSVNEGIEYTLSIQ